MEKYEHPLRRELCKKFRGKNKNKYTQCLFSSLAHIDDVKCKVVFSRELVSLRVQFGSVYLLSIMWLQAPASTFSGLE